MADVPHEDVQVVRHVLSSRTNYYLVLGVDRTSSELQIKAAYKRLALKCHPDKNRDARAAEAFKLLNTAHTVLADPQKRQVYNTHGAEGLQRQESTGSPYAAHQQADPFHMRQRFRPGGAHHPHHGEHPFANFEHVELNVNALFPVLMMLIIFFVFTMSQAMFQDDGSTNRMAARRVMRSLFSLTVHRDHGFVVQRTTSYLSENGIKSNYHVRANFYDSLKQYNFHLRDVEIEVLRAQGEYLERRCNSELLRRQGSTTNRRTRQSEEDQPQVCKDVLHIQRFLG